MIFIATDHAGFTLKKKIIQFLENESFKIADLGPKKFDSRDDYPDYAFALAKKVSLDPKNKGVLICRSGIGMTIAANKVKGAKAALCLNKLQAKKAREHNNANILVLAADFTSFGQMKEIIRRFLQTKFSNKERHKRRLEKIKKFEGKL